MTETELRRLAVRYWEAVTAQDKALALNPYSEESRKACALALRRYNAYHKAAQRLFGHSITSFPAISAFLQELAR